MSFSLKDIVMTPSEMPLWYSILPAKKGIVSYETIPSPNKVNNKSSEPKVESSIDEVTMSGRSEGASNSFINGKYVFNGSLVASKPVYAMPSHHTVLYYHHDKGAWVISDSVGSTSNALAYVQCNSDFPFDTNEVWKVLTADVNRQNQSKTKHNRITDMYEFDHALTCKKVQYREAFGFGALFEDHNNNNDGSNLTESKELESTLGSASIRSSRRWKHTSKIASKKSQSHDNSSKTNFTFSQPQALTLNDDEAKTSTPIKPRNKAQKERRTLTGEEAKERKNLFSSLRNDILVLKEQVDAIVSMKEVWRGALDAEDYSDLFEESAVETTEALDSCLKMFDDVLRRDTSLAKINLGAPVCRAMQLISVPLQTFVTNCGASLELFKDAIGREQSIRVALGIKEGQTVANAPFLQNITNLLSKCKRIVTSIAPLSSYVVAGQSESNQFIRAIGAVHKLEQSTLQALSRNTAPFVVSANTLSRETAGVLNIPSAISLNESPKRMSMVPDAKLDYDNLPISDDERRLPLSDSDEEDDESPIVSVSPIHRRGAPRMHVMKSIVEEEEELPLGDIDVEKPLEECSFFHGILSKEDAVALIDKQEVADGLFIVRKRLEGDTSSVLTLFYKGRATHHLIEVDAIAQTVIFNKRFKAYDCKTVPQALRAINRGKVSSWPQKLTRFVPREEVGPDEIDEDLSFLLS
eukprot:m.6953 g.6953  ORF g.6953 m.6953 type:complete len:695 (+) comp5611_c0_seq1:421-2505(+)